MTGFVIDPAIVDGVVVTGLGALGWLFKRHVSKGAELAKEREGVIDETLQKLGEGQESMRRSLDRIEVTLVGVNGENGLNSEVKRLRDGQDELWREFNRHRPPAA